jgi:hypothetical protein
MAGRTGDTFKKRQKEVARAEKQKEKIARRMERKLHKRDPDKPESSSDVSDGDIQDNPDNLSQSPESGAP